MKLSVVHIHQEKQNSCWHAAARMLHAFRHSQCVHPMPDKYEKDEGIGAEDFIKLAMTVGLTTVPEVNQTFDWTYIEQTLTCSGPIWAAGQWNGPNHIIVITGVESNGTLYVNDPAFPAPVVREMGWFNQKIDKTVPIPMMYLP